MPPSRSTPSGTRLISLCPSVTETLFALGLGEHVVARTRWCVEPRAMIEQVPTIGGTKNPDLDAIVSLAPDLVLMNEEENRLEDAEALRARGIAIRTHFPRDVAGARAMVLDLGVLLGCEAASGAIIAEIDRAQEEVRIRAESGARLKVAYLIWRRPWMAVGGGTYVDALLAEAGMQNVVSGSSERYPEVDLRALVAAGAQALLLSSEPYPFQEKHIADAMEASGLEREQLLLVDGQALSWYGSRTSEGLKEVHRLAEKLRQLFPRDSA